MTICKPCKANSWWHMGLLFSDRFGETTTFPGYWSVLFWLWPGSLKGKRLSLVFRSWRGRSPCSVFDFLEGSYSKSPSEKNSPDNFFLKACQNAISLQRSQKRDGMKKICIRVTPLFGGRAEMRAEVASYSVQLAGKGLLWLRGKEEGFERFLLVIVRAEQLFSFYGPVFAGNILQRSCSFGSFLWETIDSSVGVGQSHPSTTTMLLVHRWIFCWLPSSHFGSCVLGWKELQFRNYGDLVLTFDDLTS